MKTLSIITAWLILSFSLFAQTCPTSIRVGSSCGSGTSCSPCSTTNCCHRCTGTVDVVGSYETYVKRVLVQEWVNCWGSQTGGMNSLQAGAVGIRSYTIPRISSLASCHGANYDICRTTCCHVYSTTQSTNSNDAVDNTVNKVLVSGSTIQLTEYARENNNKGCGDGYTGAGTSCIYDPVCTGEGPDGNSHGRGMCQNGTARWATGLDVVMSSCNWGSSHGQGTKTWQQILNHYYPNYTITNCGGGGGCTPPSAPTTTFGTSSCPGDDGDELDWNSVSGATGYLVYVSRYPYGSSNLVSNFNPYDCADLGLTTSLDVSSLEPGMLYRWNMNATSDCNDSNCESPISSTKYFHIPPNIDANGSTDICQGEDVRLELNPNPTPGSGASKTYQWYRNGNQISGATSASYNATQAGDYTIKITYTGSSSCASGTTDASNEIDVTILDQPAEPEIDGSLNFCVGSNTTLTVSNQNQCDDCTYDWSDGTNDETSITVSSAGTYSVTATNSCGSASASVNVTETNNQPAPTIIGDTEICPGESTTLSIGNNCGGCSYDWSDGSSQQSLIVNAAGTYSVTVTGNCGTASSSQTVTLISPCPTGIEETVIADLKIFPNPTNGSFTIRLTATTSQEIQIGLLNTLGQLIYQTSSEKIIGEYSKTVELNNKVASGVYLVKIKAGTSDMYQKIIVQ